MTTIWSRMTLILVNLVNILVLSPILIGTADIQALALAEQAYLDRPAWTKKSIITSAKVSLIWGIWHWHVLNL
jgi:hypothetical protein